jgi:hypothetical protein
MTEFVRQNGKKRFSVYLKVPLRSENENKGDGQKGRH